MNKVQGIYYLFNQQSLPRGVKAISYPVYVCNAILGGSETWPFKQDNIIKLKNDARWSDGCIFQTRILNVCCRTLEQTTIENSE